MSESWTWKSGPMSLAQARYVIETEIGFCGCGRPEDALGLIHRFLGYYNQEAEKTTHFDWNRVSATHESGLIYFILYQFDRVGLIEHGGSVPGWLTEKGLALREALRQQSHEEFFEGHLDLSNGEILAEWS